MEVFELPLGELIPYENNPRKNDEAVEKVAASIREFGFKVPIIVDKENVIVAGHTRLKAAEVLGLKTVPVIRADDLTDEQVKAFRLADNKTAELAEWDLSALAEELEKLKDFDMTQFGFDDLKIDEDIERKEVGEIEEKYQIIIDCENEIDMQEKYNGLTEAGYECRILTL